MDSYLPNTFLLLTTFTVSLSMEPEFDMPVVNVTVKELETAILPCSVKFLGNHQVTLGRGCLKVVWTDQFSTLLSYEDRRIIDDERLSIERPFTKDWNLHIRKVKHSDQGVYNCQINTVPVKVKTINLRVEVPAKIIDHLSTRDITVQENDHVTLVCNVTGVPPPKVTWYRHFTGRSGMDKQKVGVNGEVLVIHNITRYCSDIYECVAFNEVQPAANRLIKVEVKFAPEIYLPNKRIGQDLGKETILECTVTAFPHGTTVWMRLRGEEIRTLSQKYRLEVYEDDRDTITLSLRVFSIDVNDYGIYNCVASNALGKDSEAMVLYEYSANIKATTTTTTSTTAMPSSTPRIMIYPPIAPRTTIHSTVDSRRTDPDSYKPRPYHPDQRTPQHSGQGSAVKENRGSGFVSLYSSTSACVLVFLATLIQHCPL